MTNSIATNQGTADAIALLRAQRHLYGVAKRLAGAQAFVAVGAPLFSVCASLLWPALRPLAAVTALLGVILDVLVLDPWQKKLKTTAAATQEAFDCAVLELPWNESLAEGHVDPEDQHAANLAHSGGKPDPSLQNWYPPAVADLPLHQGRIVCQRANLRWDADLQRRYADGLTAVVAVVGAGALYGALFGNFTMEQFVVWALAPLTPLLVWGIREQYRHREAAGALDRLKKQIQTLWDRALQATRDPTACAAESRRFQDQLFEYRRASPLIFEWIYRLRRRSMEEEMKAATSHFLKESQERGSS